MSIEGAPTIDRLFYIKLIFQMMRNVPNTFPPRLLHQVHEIEMMSRFFMYLLKTRQIKPLKIEIFATIISFLSAEAESLSYQQLKAILNNHRGRVHENEIKEVKNISQICQHLSEWDPLSIQDFKRVHQLLMKGINEEGGCFRKEQVVVVEGKKITHVPPSPREVAALMKEQFQYARTQKNSSWLIKASVFHYGVQYIHPFADGNGRMGRIWQHLLLLKASPIFQYILIGDLIKKNIRAYYRSLDQSDKKENAYIFIEFCLHKIAHALKQIAKERGISSFIPLSRYYEALTKYKSALSTKKYHACFAYLSLSTARRDLQLGRRFAQYFSGLIK